MTTLKRTKEYVIVPGTPGLPGTPPYYEFLPDPPPLGATFAPAAGGTTFPFFGGQEGTITTNITSYNGTPGNYVLFVPKDPTQPVQVVRV